MRLSKTRTFSHCPDNAEDVDVVRYLDLLQDSVERDERTGPADAGAAVHRNWPLVGPDPLAERPHEARQRLGRVRHPKVGPRGKVEVAQDALRVTLCGKEDHEFGSGDSP